MCIALGVMEEGWIVCIARASAYYVHDDVCFHI